MSCLSCGRFSPSERIVQLTAAQHLQESPPAGASDMESKRSDGTIDASSANLWKTEAQRWGNFYTKKRPPGADPYSSQRSCWRKPRSKCDVTEYGDRLVQLCSL